MTKIGIILGSTRPGRNGEAVAKWVLELASQRTDAEFELIDLLDYKLPHLDEAIPPSMAQYTQPHTQQWAAKIAYPVLERMASVGWMVEMACL